MKGWINRGGRDEQFSSDEGVSVLPAARCAKTGLGYQSRERKETDQNGLPQISARFHNFAAGSPPGQVAMARRLSIGLFPVRVQGLCPWALEEISERQTYRIGSLHGGLKRFNIR